MRHAYTQVAHPIRDVVGRADEPIHRAMRRTVTPVSEVHVRPAAGRNSMRPSRRISVSVVEKESASAS